jgi:hypothetical protein
VEQGPYRILSPLAFGSCAGWSRFRLRTSPAHLATG